MTARGMTLATATVILAMVTASCDSKSTGPTNNPDIPTEWVSAVTNTYFPLVPGTTYHYESATSEGLETNTVAVLVAPRVVNGVTATAVHDEVFLDGELIEDTEDWFAQDTAGNVWYLGEDSKEIENGKVVSTTGSWEWGIDGALPGIIMWADPAAHIGEEYRQEFSKGVAEDVGKVVAVDQRVQVRYESFTGCIKTDERNALEPGQLENKYYCPRIGTTLELSPGSGERVELVDVTGP